MFLLTEFELFDVFEVDYEYKKSSNLYDYFGIRQFPKSGR